MKKSFLLFSLLLSFNAAAESSVNKAAFLKAYADHAFARYSGALNSAKELRTALKAFTVNPTLETQSAAKAAWTAARTAYSPTEVFRMAGGPIDATDESPEGYLNSWPLDESTIDYVLNNDSTSPGIINNPETYADISPDALKDLNGAAGESAVTTGYHAIEFLLWGQDFWDESAGRRCFTDYIENPSAEQLAACPLQDEFFTVEARPNAARRAEYLNSIADLLVSDLQIVVDAWNPALEDAYVHFFLDPQNADDQVLAIATGLNKFTGNELAGERIFPAYDQQTQEQEHSCFSDQTTKDFKYDFLGISEILNDMETGPGLISLVQTVDEAAAEDLRTSAAATDAAIQLVDEHAPFDTEIRKPDTRPLVLDAFTKLTLLAFKIQNAADALGSAK